MLRSLPGLVLRYTLPFLVFIALLAYPLWSYRCAHGLFWDEMVRAMGFMTMPEVSPMALGEPRAAGILLEYVSWLLVISILPAFVMARLAGRRLPWGDVLALAAIRMIGGTLIAILISLVLYLLLAFATLGVRGPAASYAALVGVGLVLLWLGSRSVADLGDLIRPVGGRAVPVRPYAYNLGLAFLVLPLILAFISADHWVPALWGGELVRGRSFREAFLVLGIVEAVCLVATVFAWAMLWHRCHGPVHTIDQETVAEAFA